ncbi:MAG: hypothetical protein M0009_14200 [Deltaproteobacteria bacterium]|nr:hypothetical protein [Deltaproteobacteria bacterium]
MKRVMLIAALGAIVLTGLTAPAFADEFGDRMAGALCSHEPGNFGIIMTEEEVKIWNQAHEGISYGPTSQYTFKKNAGTDAALCLAQKMVPPGSSLSADVTRTGAAVKVGFYR